MTVTATGQASFLGGFVPSDEGPVRLPPHRTPLGGFPCEVISCDAGERRWSRRPGGHRHRHESDPCPLPDEELLMRSSW